MDELMPFINTTHPTYGSDEPSFLRLQKKAAFDKWVQCCIRSDEVPEAKFSELWRMRFEQFSNGTFNEDTVMIDVMAADRLGFTVDLRLVYDLLLKHYSGPEARAGDEDVAINAREEHDIDPKIYDTVARSIRKFIVLNARATSERYWSVFTGMNEKVDTQSKVSAADQVRTNQTIFGEKMDELQLVMKKRCLESFGELVSAFEVMGIMHHFNKMINSSLSALNAEFTERASRATQLLIDFYLESDVIDVVDA